MRAAIGAGHDALRQSIAGASARWEQSPGGEEWSPRRVAEHAVGVDLAFASMVAGAVGGPAPERREFSFASADEALAAFTEVTAATAPVYGRVGDGDLGTAVERLETLSAVLDLAASHASLHAEQIDGAT